MKDPDTMPSAMKVIEALGRQVNTTADLALINRLCADGRAIVADDKKAAAGVIAGLLYVLDEDDMMKVRSQIVG